MAESGEISKEKRPVERSLEDMLAELDAQLRLASEESMADLTWKAEGYYQVEVAGLQVEVTELRAQVTELQAQVTGLQYAKRLLEQRVKSLEAPTGWRPSRRAGKRAWRDATARD